MGGAGDAAAGKAAMRLLIAEDDSATFRGSWHRSVRRGPTALGQNAGADIPSVTVACKDGRNQVRSSLPMLNARVAAATPMPVSCSPR